MYEFHLVNGKGIIKSEPAVCLRGELGIKRPDSSVRPTLTLFNGLFNKISSSLFINSLSIANSPQIYLICVTKKKKKKLKFKWCYYCTMQNILQILNVLLYKYKILLSPE